MSSKSSRRGILVVLAAIVAGGFLSDSDTGTIIGPMPGSGDILEVLSGKRVVPDDGTYAAARWEGDGAIAMQGGDSVTFSMEG